jgi:hypothetical protein
MLSRLNPTHLDEKALKANCIAMWYVARKEELLQAVDTGILKNVLAVYPDGTAVATSLSNYVVGVKKNIVGYFEVTTQEGTGGKLRTISIIGI